MKNTKRIAAIIGVVILVSLPIIAIISAFFATEQSNAFFLASIFSAVMIPILVYGFIMVYKLARRNKSNEIDVDDQTDPEE